MGLEAIAASSGVEIGFAIALFTAVLGGIRRNDTRFNTMEKHSESRFNKLENQMATALKGRMTRQEHQIWVLQLQVKNPTIHVPVATGEEAE
jgi:hypothetical protein